MMSLFMKAIITLVCAIVTAVWIMACITLVVLARLVCVRVYTKRRRKGDD